MNVVDKTSYIFLFLFQFLCQTRIIKHIAELPSNDRKIVNPQKITNLEILTSCSGNHIKNMKYKDNNMVIIFKLQEMLRFSMLYTGVDCFVDL